MTVQLRLTSGSRGQSFREHTIDVLPSQEALTFLAGMVKHFSNGQNSSLQNARNFLDPARGKINPDQARQQLQISESYRTLVAVLEEAVEEMERELAGPEAA